MNAPAKALVGLQAWLAPVLAAVVFGGWAAYVNAPHGAGSAVRAGLAQGGYALVSTRVVSWTALAAWEHVAIARWRFLWAFFAAFTVMLSIPLLVHGLLRTPEVLAAVLPGAIWGSAYIALYLLLQRNGGW